MKFPKKFVILMAALAACCSIVLARDGKLDSARQNVILTPHLPPATRYEGVLAGKSIVMLLSDRSADLTGGYAYIAPTGLTGSPNWIRLNGKRERDGKVLLTETVGKTVTGNFNGKVQGSSFSGIWSSPKGKRFAFSTMEMHSTNPQFVAEVSTSPKSVRMTKLSIYENKKLLQSIPVDVELYGPLGLLEYDRGDYNFDGYPDFSLSASNLDHLYLIFDPAKNRYLTGPASLQNVGVTAIDYGAHELVEEYGRSGDLRLNVFKFVNGKYCQIEETAVLGSPETAKTHTKTYPVAQCHKKKD